jgi:hypothetical protein
LGTNLFDCRSEASAYGGFRVACMIPILIFGLSGCAANLSPAEPLVNAPVPLTIPTYDGSGQVTEPDMIFFNSPWHGFQYWMAFSPYPFTNPAKENPSIGVSNDGVNWQVPDGLENPLVLPNGMNYLSDASIFYDRESDQLWVYYNVTLATSGNALGVNRIVSPDGVHWHNDGQLFQIPPCRAVSPTVGKVASTYFMWSVDPNDCEATSSTVTYRMSADGLNWSNPQSTNMAQDDYVIWHININYVPSKNEWWAAVTAYPRGQDCCTNTRLFFSKSGDGIHWTPYGKPILSASASGWDDSQIYRSSFLFDAQNNEIQVWYSAADPEAWRIGFTREDYNEFLSWLVAK